MKVVARKRTGPKQPMRRSTQGLTEDPPRGNGHVNDNHGDGHGNGHGGGGGKGNGGGGKGGGKGGHRQEEQQGQAAQTAESMGDLAFNPGIRDLNDEIGQGRNQKGIIASAYDDYRAQLSALQASQKAASEGVQAGMRGDAEVMQGLGANLSEQAVADAQKRAALMGAGDQVASEIATTAGGSAMGLQAGQNNAISGAAKMGLADFTNMGQRSAVSGVAEMEAQDSNLDYVRGLKEEKREAKADKADYIQQQLQTLKQQRKENKLARDSLEADIAASEADQELAEKAMKLDQKDTRHDNKLADRTQAANEADDAHDNALDDKEARQAAKEARQDARDAAQAGAPSGLSDSERKEYSQKVNQVKSAMDIYTSMRLKGASVGKASSAARKRAGVDRWVLQVVQDLSSGGKLSQQSRKLIKAHFPGGQIPQAWR